MNTVLNTKCGQVQYHHHQQSIYISNYQQVQPLYYPVTKQYPTSHQAILDHRLQGLVKNVTLQEFGSHLVQNLPIQKIDLQLH